MCVVPPSLQADQQFVSAFELINRAASSAIQRAIDVSHTNYKTTRDTTAKHTSLYNVLCWLPS